MYAALYAGPECVKLLIDHGAPVNAILQGRVNFDGTQASFGGTNVNWIATNGSAIGIAARTNGAMGGGTGIANLTMGFGSLLDFELDVGLDDEAWLKTEDDPEKRIHLQTPAAAGRQRSLIT